MKLITGYQLEDHVTSLHDAMWHRGIWKDDCIISVGENLKAEIISNNEIRVRSGILNMQGKFCSIDMNTYDSLTINNGTAGENRIDLIVARYEKNNETQVEDVSLKVIQGTPSMSTPSVPSYTEGNIDNGDLVAELPVFRVNIEGINIVGVDNLIDTVPAFTDMNPTLLFQGAIKTGDIKLNDNMYNYRFLYIKVSASTSGYTYGGGIYTIIDPILNNSNNKTQTVMGYEVPSNDDTNSVITYSGVFVNTNETTLTVFKEVSNVSHQSGKNHTGGTKYYVREIFGIR